MSTTPTLFLPGDDSGVEAEASVTQQLGRGRSSFFATSADAKTLAIFEPSAFPQGELQLRETEIEDERRVLATSEELDVAALLYPTAGKLQLACGDRTLPAEAPQSVTADSLAIVATGSGPEDAVVLAYVSQSPAASEPSLFTVKGCKLSKLEPSSSLGSGPFEVTVEERQAYFSSDVGVSRLDLTRVPLAPELLTSTPLRELQPTSSGWAVGRSERGIEVLSPLDGTLTALEAQSAGGADLGSGGDGGAGSGGDAPLGAAGSAGISPVATGAYAVSPSGAFVLVADGREVTRYPIPPDGSSLRVTAPGSALILGEGGDCAITYAPGDARLTRIRLGSSLSDGVPAALDAETVELDRRVETATLACDSRTGAADCCHGAVLVVYQTQTRAALGSTEAYGIVAMDSLAATDYVSALRVRAQSVFDDANAWLLALSDSSFELNELHVLTPFAQDASPFVLERALGGRPAAAGRATSSMGYVALDRRDGGIVFVARQGDPSVGSRAYRTFKRLDFRLADRVDLLEGP